MRQIIYKLIIFIFILFLLPVYLIISILIVASSGLPILYKQYRVGKKGKRFLLYKFRTMKPNSDKLKSSLKDLNEADGPVFKIYNDPRFTKIGRFLNHTGLDELPQFFNILKGEMALFGPRPLPVSEVNKMTPGQKKRHLIKPGIVSPWIFDGYHTKSFAQWMKSDIKYCQQKSAVYDVGLFIKSINLLANLMKRNIGKDK